MGRHPDVKRFYQSKAWQRCREEYAKSQGYICEHCAAQGLIVYGEIVHHKNHVNVDSVTDPGITLNFDNLELLCRKCHAQEHGEMYGKDKRRYSIVEGRVVALENPLQPPFP